MSKKRKLAGGARDKTDLLAVDAVEFADENPNEFLSAAEEGADPRAQKMKLDLEGNWGKPWVDAAMEHRWVPIHRAPKSAEQKEEAFQKRIQQCIAFLEKHGYTVAAPEAPFAAFGHNAPPEAPGQAEIWANPLEHHPFEGNVRLQGLEVPLFVNVPKVRDIRSKRKGKAAGPVFGPNTLLLPDEAKQIEAKYGANPAGMDTIMRWLEAVAEQESPERLQQLHREVIESRPPIRPAAIRDIFLRVIARRRAQL
jgi:hypothetical protein